MSLKEFYDVTVTLIDGEGKEVSFDMEYTTDYIWKDGNFSCNCNRELFFRRYSGQETENTVHEIKCTPPKHRVKITDKTGSILYVEL